MKHFSYTYMKKKTKNETLMRLKLIMQKMNNFFPEIIAQETKKNY